MYLYIYTYIHVCIGLPLSVHIYTYTFICVYTHVYTPARVIGGMSIAVGLSHPVVCSGMAAWHRMACIGFCIFVKMRS